MSAKQRQPEATEQGPSLTKEWNTAWEALEPLRATWDEKEQSLLAKANDSVSGNVVAARVSDAALSTLAFERQARISAQLPTGRVYALNKADEAKAKLLNIVLNRYILPNADSQYDMLIKIRLWGVYASVYGSMPMFYDYRVDDRYIGPDCRLVNPRCFAPVAGFHNVQEQGCFISTTVGFDFLEDILERPTTSYDKKAVRELLDLAKNSRPKSDDDGSRQNTAIGQRYDKSSAKNRVEIVTKYTPKRWVSFAPDFTDKATGKDLVIRDMDNRHSSKRVPVIMRHCFPLLDSVFGLGDFERGMKIQKAKDSIINLFLEGAKNRVYPPLKIVDANVTMSSIKYQAGTKWHMTDINAVQPMDFGQSPLGEFQGTYSALQSMLQNQFGTSDTTLTQQDSGNPAFGKTPQALKMQAARENARDNWDRFMSEKAVEELFEGMLNLLSMKMESPINFSVFEDDIKALGYQPAQVDVTTGMQTDEQLVEGLDVFSDAKAGKLSLAKDALKPTLSGNAKEGKGYSYLIDASSTMKQDEEEQFQALMATWNLAHSTPNLMQSLVAGGMEYDEAEHLKMIFIAAGISDWERILKEVSPQTMQAMAQQQMAGMMPPQDPMTSPMPDQQMAAYPPYDPTQEFSDPQIAAVAQSMFSDQMGGGYG